MSLRSIDITKIKRLSLKGVKLPDPEVNEPEIKHIEVQAIEKPPTDEEMAYSKLVAINPLIEELVDRLSLVSTKTGERIRKVEVREDYKQEPVDNSKLIALAGKVIKGEETYSKADIVARIKKATNISQERAERGFIVMLQAGAIEQAINPELYHLGGSTPF